MTYEEAYAKLKARGEEQLLRFYPHLADEERQSLLSQIDELDFSCLDHMGERNAAGAKGIISPLKAMTIPEIERSSAAFRRAGTEAIRGGKLAAVLLAGGMGTRLGTDGPKGCFDIGVTRHVYIFQRLMENLEDMVRETGAPVHLFIMTSEKNDGATRKFFRDHGFFGYPASYVHFFRQGMAPTAGEDGHVLLETKSRIAVSPNGNGGWFRSMLSAGYGDVLQAEGIEWLNVFAVDNVLQKICDPVFFGAVLTGGYECGAKVVRKVSPDEKVGVMCLEDGHPSVVEYYEMTDEMRTAADESGERLYNFGVILNYLFRVPDLMRIVNERMPLHFAHKKVPCIDAAGNPVDPKEPNGWKFEYFILDMIHELDSCLPFEVSREREFAPVKNRTGADSVDTARGLLRMNGYEL